MVDGPVLVVAVALLLVIVGAAAVTVMRRIVVPGVQGKISSALEPGVHQIEIAIFNRSGFADSIRFLRQVGFFADANDLTDLELAEELAFEAEQELEAAKASHFTGMMIGQRRGTPTTTFPKNWLALSSQPFPDSRTVDLIVASFDRTRVWWQDRDRVYRNYDGFVITLQEWARISRGAFQPEDVYESWGEDGEMIVVTFTLNDEQHTYIHLTSLDTYIDTVGLRDLINPLIAETGYQFAICEVRGDPNVVMILTEDERLRMVEERGWQFVEWRSLVV